jgi:hypothetical protein
MNFKIKLWVHGNEREKRLRPRKLDFRFSPISFLIELPHNKIHALAHDEKFHSHEKTIRIHGTIN